MENEMKQLYTRLYRDTHGYFHILCGLSKGVKQVYIGVAVVLQGLSGVQGLVTKVESQMEKKTKNEMENTRV